MTAPVQLALLIVGLWLLIASAVLAVLVALGLAGERVGLAVRRAFYRRTALGYPPDGAGPRYVLIEADGRRRVIGRPERRRRPVLAAAAGLALVASLLVACEDPHKGQHCVREKTSTRPVQVGKVTTYRKSTRCVEWAPDAKPSSR